MNYQRILIIISSVHLLSCSDCIEGKDIESFNKFEHNIINKSNEKIIVKQFNDYYHLTNQFKELEIDDKNTLTITLKTGAFFAPFELIDSIQITRTTDNKVVLFKPNDNNKYSPFLSENCDSTYYEKDFIYKYDYYVKDEIFE